MAHVRAGHNDDGIARRLHGPCHALPHRHELLKGGRHDGDGHYGGLRREVAYEGELDLKGVLEHVGLAVTRCQGDLPGHPRGEGGVYGDGASGYLPLPLGHDGDGGAEARVVWAEEHEGARDLHARIDRSGHRAGVDEARVGAHGGYGLVLGGGGVHVAADLAFEPFGVGLVELSRDGGRPLHREV
jgi:hypothetical protein